MLCFFGFSLSHSLSFQLAHIIETTRAKASRHQLQVCTLCSLLQRPVQSEAARAIVQWGGKSEWGWDCARNSTAATTAAASSNKSGEEGRGQAPSMRILLKGKRPLVFNPHASPSFQSFGRAERLEEHLRTHTGETPFKCDICLKGFTTKHNLLRHRNIHTLEKKYTCEICFKYFADPTQHKRHQATHFAKHNKDGAKGGENLKFQKQSYKIVFVKVANRAVPVMSQARCRSLYLKWCDDTESKLVSKPWER